MEWKNVFNNIHVSFWISTLLWVTTAFSKEKIPELITKQDINNIRFISEDGNFTLYQRRSGDLHLSKHFKIHVIMNGDMGTQYSIQSAKEKKFLIVTKQSNFHTVLNPLVKKEIYLLPYGKTKMEKIADGIDPRFHLGETWMSYYDPTTKNIVFQSIQNRLLQFSIKSTNKLAPYFIPERVMINSDLILYTDINEKGLPGVLALTRSKNKRETVYKSDFINQKIQLCLGPKGLLIGEFPIFDSKDQHSYISIIASSNLTPFEYTKREVIYESKSKDLGQIVCKANQAKFFFIKNVLTQSGHKRYEAASIDYKEHKLIVETEHKYISQLIEMDGRVLFPLQGSYYLLSGKNQEKVNFDAKTE